MSVAKKEFNEVFKKFQFPDSMLKALGHSLVNDIQFYNKENRLNIDLEFAKIIDEKYIKLFQDELIKTYSFDNCSIDYNYILEEYGTKKRIELYWSNLIKSINEISPISNVVLSLAKWNFQDNSLTLTLHKNGSYILRGRGIDSIIKKLLNDRLKIDIAVILKDLKENDCDKETYLNEQNKIETKLIETITQNTETNSIDKPRETFNQNQNGFKKFAGKRNRDIQFNDELTGVRTKLNEQLEMDDEIFIIGKIIAFELRETKSGKFLVTFDVTDGVDSITVKFFANPEKYDDNFKSLLKKRK